MIIFNTKIEFKNIKNIFFFWGSIIMIVILLSPFLFATGICKERIDNLENERAGKFPSSWRTWPFQRGKAGEVYTVKEENGMKFLHASDDKDLSIQVFRKFYWPVEKKPNLSWKWRALTLPVGAMESDDGKNDSACGVYAIFGQMSGHAIKYVWSSTLPAGQVVTRRDGNLKIKVLKSGSNGVGKWQEESINITKDYKELFGSDLKKDPTGIAILTDGNATHKPAACDYTEFVVSGSLPIK